MDKLYKKNEVSFAIVCILIYVVGTSASEAIAQITGTAKLVPMIFHVGFALIILTWLRKNNLFRKYGLIRPEYKSRQALYFIPLFIIAFSSIAFGVMQKYPVSETIMHMISMIAVGFLEEIVFRGFLFVGMAKQNLCSAIIVSSVTFGIGHIANLLSGQDVLETILQILFAVAVGFSLVILFYKGKSLLPCIAFHGINNALHAISNDAASLKFFGTRERELYITAGIGVVLSIIYCVYIWKQLKPEEKS